MSKECKISVNTCKMSSNCMLFTRDMNKRKIYSYSALGSLVILIWMFPEQKKQAFEFSETVKIVLRETGHQLLLANKDSTSLVLPVTETNPNTYKISFQRQLSIEPNNLTSFLQNNVEKVGLPSNYIAHILQCSDQEVAYSYIMRPVEADGIIPCNGRSLPKDCYTIEVKFPTQDRSTFPYSIIFYSLIAIAFFVLEFIVFKTKEEKGDDVNDTTPDEIELNYTALGRFQFYPEQNKLIREAEEISLSRKECELLAIFVAQPNQVIKRDELSKKVWEDNGVVVGRSLDTYISKLRKKLKDDESIKLTNIHGVGYKLEVNS